MQGVIAPVATAQSPTAEASHLVESRLPLARPRLVVRRPRPAQLVVRCWVGSGADIASARASGSG
jgi:hypothetical protein